MALAGLTAHASSGRPKEENRTYGGLIVLHGAGAILALTGGFGLLARLDLMEGGAFPGWIWVKLVLWILLGAAVALLYRRRELAMPLLLLLPLLGFLGAALANYKPF